MEKSKEKENLLLRLRRIEGQVRGIQRMIDEEATCGEILNQVAAVKSAISQVGLLIFESHARECICTALKDQQTDDNLLEIVTLMSRLLK